MREFATRAQYRSCRGQRLTRLYSYEVLSDGNKRSVYDQAGKAGLEGGMGGGGGMDPQDLFSQLFGGGGGFFGGGGKLTILVWSTSTCPHRKE